MNKIEEVGENNEFDVENEDEKQKENDAQLASRTPKIEK